MDGMVDKLGEGGAIVSMKFCAVLTNWFKAKAAGYNNLSIKISVWSCWGDKAAL